MRLKTILSLQEAILSFILEKKKEYEKKMKEYEKQKESEVEEMKDMAAAEKEQMKRKFEQTEKSIVTKRIGDKTQVSLLVERLRIKLFLFVGSSIFIYKIDYKSYML